MYSESCDCPDKLSIGPEVTSNKTQEQPLHDNYEKGLVVS
jgi:hypothetical protein